MSTTLQQRLLPFARELQHARDFGKLLEVVQTEIIDALGYRHVWLFVSDTEEVRELRLLQLASALGDELREHAHLLTVKGDAMLEEIVAANAPVVVEDARTDPRTDKKIVGSLGNRTIVNVPLRLVDKPFGALGMGTFGDEGCRVPSEAELDFLVGVGGLVSVAASRIRLVEHETRRAREQRAIELRLAEAQRLESLGKLAGGIAHDFNNLLTVVFGAAGLLRAKAKGAFAAELDDIVGAAERGHELTKQLLSMSRSQPLEPHPIDLDARTHPLLTMLRRVLPANIIVDINSKPPLPLIAGDPGQIDQVLMNLVLNARDAMPTGGRLTVANEALLIESGFVVTHPWARLGHFVRTTIADTGGGMSREVVDHILSHFSRRAPARAARGSGSRWRKASSIGTAASSIARASSASAPRSKCSGLLRLHPRIEAFRASLEGSRSLRRLLTLPHHVQRQRVLGIPPEHRLRRRHRPLAIAELQARRRQPPTGSSSHRAG